MPYDASSINDVDYYARASRPARRYPIRGGQDFWPNPEPEEEPVSIYQTMKPRELVEARFADGYHLLYQTAQLELSLFLAIRLGAALNRLDVMADLARTTDQQIDEAREIAGKLAEQINKAGELLAPDHDFDLQQAKGGG